MLTKIKNFLQYLLHTIYLFVTNIFKWIQRLFYGRTNLKITKRPSSYQDPNPNKQAPAKIYKITYQYDLLGIKKDCDTNKATVDLFLALKSKELSKNQFKELLDAGANFLIKEKNAFSNTCLMWSIANANIPSAIAFLDALYEYDKKLCKDLINTVSGTTHTALTLALAKGWDHKNEDNPTYPMHSAIQKLITYGAEINHRQKENGNTALHYAYLHKDEEAIQYLIKNGADITIKNEKGETPTMMYKYSDSETEEYLEKACRAFTLSKRNKSMQP